MKILFGFIYLFLLITSTAYAATGTKVVMLGTGTPVPDAKRAGPGVAVIHNNKAYLFDAGAGVVRNAIIANQTMGIDALNPAKIEHLFFTHMHSDHVNDFSELVQTIWWRKHVKVNVYGPKEIVDMAEGMYAMTAPDTQFRLNSIQPKIREDAWQVNTHLIKKGGIVYKDEGIEIEAFEVPHGEFKPAFGYKIVTEDKTIVISGDTAFSDVVVEKSKGADILIHEVISRDGLNSQSPLWQKYHLAYHTTTDQVAKIANQVKPEILVLYHALFYGTSEQRLLEEVKEKYKGKVVLADDLDVF